MRRAFGWVIWLLAATISMTVLSDMNSQALAQVFTEPKAKAKPSPSKQTPKPKRQRTGSADTPSTGSKRISTFSDPVFYCAANPDSESIASTYVGQPLPNWITVAMKPAQSKAASTESVSYNWRCMTGRVYACASEIGKASCSRPVDERVPTNVMTAYCKNKKRGAIPPDLAGNVIPMWACSRQGPTITGYRTDIDNAGYLLNQWSDITDFAPSNTIGSVPRSYVGSWTANVNTKRFMSADFRIEIDLTGGQFGELVGRVKYIQTNTGFDSGPSLVCSSQISLSGYGNGQLIGSESITERSAMIDACPVKGPIIMQLRSDQLWLEWRRSKDNKVTLSGSAYRN